MDGDWLGRWVEVVIEAPAGSFVKRRPDGVVDVVSPLPVPYNYGYVVGALGGDGDPLDALVVGGRLPAGHRARWRVHGVVRFVDAGASDLKLVCGPLRRRDRLGVAGFFAVYAPFKRALHALRREGGATRVDGIDWADAPRGIRGRTGR